MAYVNRTGLVVPVSNYRRRIKDFGTCLLFDGTQGIVNLGTDNIFDGNFYFSAWIKWGGSNSDYQHIFAKRDSYGASTMMFDLHLNNSTNILTVDTSVGSKSFSIVFPVGKWIHLVWVHDSTNFREIVYINAEKIHDDTGQTLATGTSSAVTIGGVVDALSEAFNGEIDEIAIGNIAPTWDQVVNMYSSYEYPSAWTYLKLDEATGTTALDASENGNNGTISNASYVTDKVLTTRSTVSSRFTPVPQTMSLYYNGSSSYSVCPISPDVNGFSFGLWLFFDGQPSANKTILSCNTSTNTNGFTLAFNNSNKLMAFTIYNGGSTTAQIQSGTYYNTWFHLAGTFKTNETKFYFNGSITGTPDLVCTMGSPGTFQLAKSLTFTTTCFKGNLTNFTYQNTSTPWTANDILNLYKYNKIPVGAYQWSMNNVATDQNTTNALTLSSTVYMSRVPDHFGINRTTV